MAVTLDVAGLIAALRLSDSPEELAEATRILAYAAEAVVQHAPNAVDSAHNEAAVRLSAFLFDQPTASRGDSYANAMRQSGAARMLLPYRIHRAGYSEAVADTQSAVGTAQNPVTGLSIVSGQLVVTFADGTTDMLDLPAGMGGGVDQDARDAANAAQATADAKVDATGAENAAKGVVSDWAEVGNSDAIPATKLIHAPNGGAPVAEINGYLPAPAVAMRLGWHQSRTFSASEFVRAGNHPIDGAAVGTSNLVLAPPFPPALNTDPTLYMAVWVAGDPAIEAFYSSTGQTETNVTAQFPAADKLPLTVEGVAGHYYPSAIRFRNNPGVRWRLFIRGAQVLTGDDVEAWARAGNTDAIPADKLTNAPAAGGGGGGEWHTVGTAAAPFTANTAKAASLQIFPIGPYPDYTALRAAIVDESIKQVVIQISQNDQGDGDSDHGTTMHPNNAHFRAFAQPSAWDLFPGHALGVDPVKFRVNFAATALQVTADAAIPASPAVSVAVGVWV